MSPENSSAQVLQAVAQSPPDFIFLDIKMPRMDGLEVLSHLAQNQATRPIPVAMLSNYDEPALVRRAHELGAKEHIVKAGTNPARLADVVKRWLTDSA